MVAQRNETEAHSHEAYRASGQQSRLKASGKSAKSVPDGGHDHVTGKRNDGTADVHNVMLSVGGVHLVSPLTVV